MGTRYEARTQIAQFFGGTTQQSVVDTNGPYINGPLQSSGLSAVYPRWAKRIPDQNYFLFATPRSMGAVMVVHIPQLGERRLALNANSLGHVTNSGTKIDNMRVELHIYHLSQLDYLEPAEQDMETLLDAVYNKIETDVTLGGAVIDAGEDSYGIQSVLNTPVFQDKPERCEQYAKISFQAKFFFIA